ncbi:MAG: cupin domain-containing protein [Pigmentiphaga sp.]
MSTQSELNDPIAMEKRIARFKTLKPTKTKYEDPSVGIPMNAYEQLAAHSIFLIMAPQGVARGGTSRPAVEGQPGVEISIVECPPGQGPALHRHERTYETFMALDGKYEITWGDDGEHSTILEPFDLIAVPAGIYRAFRNVDDHTAKLLVVIQGGKEVMNDLIFQHKVADKIEQGWGKDVLDRFSKIGIQFASPPDRE